MRRREFITLLGGTATAWPIIAGAQKSPPRLGFLSAGSAGSRTTAAQIVDIHRGLKDNGMIEGRDYVLETRFAAGHYDRFPALANELAQAGVSVVLVNTISAVRAAQALTPPISIVMLSINDPVGTGLVASLARHRLGLEVDTPEIRRAEDIAPAFEALKGRAEALYVIPDALISTNRIRINILAVGARLPTMHGFRDNVEAGGLMSYGPNYPDLWRRAADYVDKILRGAKPGDIPVEQPTKFDLIINLTTAKALSLTIPESFLLRQRADRVRMLFAALHMSAHGTKRTSRTIRWSAPLTVDILREWN